jgi:chromosome segregation protein
VFLRSLTLRGFKSFADRTTLEFTPGIGVIVGPNGSGKSNIVDAISWVLGEQGPAALRGGQMADVIFAGSPNRAPLGMAQVSLVIDNTAGLIPVPASEIEISRTVFRSGESEYRLGGRPCRLMDIQELLSDTGIGRALHTIVGQGHLDDVLQARPEERRQYIEEAAGIAKHRRRRERAVRKLAGMEGDLLRLQDLVGELRRQLKPLKQQAELAKRHEELTQEAADVAGKLAATRLRELHSERDRRRPSWQEAEALQANARARLRSLDEEIARLEAGLSEAEAEQRTAEESHHRVLQAKSEAEVRLRSAMRDEGGAKERLTAAAGRSGRLFALEEELARTEAALTVASAALETRRSELEEAEQAFRAADRAREDAEARRRALTDEMAARRAEAESLKRSMAGSEAEGRRLRASLEDVMGRSDRARARVTELEDEIRRFDERETPLARDLAAVEEDRASLSAGLADLEARRQGLLARQQVVDARRGELSESPGQAFSRRRGGRAVGVLRDLVDGPPDLLLAVRAALGPFADAVVYATRNEALADAAAESVGGVTLAVGVDRAIAPQSIEGERRLVDLVKPDPRVRGLVGELLAETYLVRNLAEAGAKHRIHPGAQFVTRDGLLVGKVFVRTAPGQDLRLEEVRRDSAALERELAGVRREIREGRSRLVGVSTRADQIRASLEETDRLITSSAEEMAALKAESSSLLRERTFLEDRLASVDALVTAALTGLEERTGERPEPPTLPPAPEPPVHLRVEVEALRRDRSRLEAGVARARKEIEELGAEDPIVLRTALSEAENERVRAEESVRGAENELAGALDAHRAATDAARRVRADHDRANRSWREQAAEVERLRGDHEEENRARLELERRIADAERLLAEGHGVEPAAAVAALSPEETVDQLQRRSDTVARRLGLLGKVNLLAVGELGALQERHDFLVRELDDVRAARRDLERVIEEIDLRMAELFDAAFRDVAREFAGLFTILFPGGEGRLTLIDPADPLGTGIDIEARPGRKRVKRLSLLSGGERSLAALAFLFAVFRARPSPFYLMDEVEAALDDVNLHRFLDLVKSFAQGSQILVVTHQKRTMETADVLYGVSMGQGGASRVISQRLSEISVG